MRKPAGEEPTLERRFVSVLVSLTIDQRFLLTSVRPSGNSSTTESVPDFPSEVSFHGVIPNLFQHRPLHTGNGKRVHTSTSSASLAIGLLVSAVAFVKSVPDDAVPSSPSLGPGVPGPARVAYISTPAARG